MTDASALMMPDARSDERTSADLNLVLVVEDQGEVRRLIERMLDHSGFEVVVAANGEDARGLLGGRSPRLIVLDFWMPIMDGWEFLERATTPAPVIVISGVEEETHPLPARVVRFLKKPIGREELMAAIEEADRRVRRQ